MKIIIIALFGLLGASVGWNISHNVVLTVFISTVAQAVTANIVFSPKGKRL